MQQKQKTCWNSNLKDFRRLFFHIITTNASDIKQISIFYKFRPIKQTFLSERIHIWHEDLTIQVKYSNILPSLHVLYFAESKGL